MMNVLAFKMLRSDRSTTDKHLALAIGLELERYWNSISFVFICRRALTSLLAQISTL